MSDSADDLILKMQHLQAQAKNALEARALRAGVERLKTAAQRLAWETQKEIADCEHIETDGEARLDALRVDGVTAEEAPEYVAVKQRIDDAKKRLVRARAQYNLALDRMSDVERAEYQAFHAEVRSETHGALAEDLTSTPE